MMGNAHKGEYSLDRLLEVTNLHTSFRTYAGVVQAVRGVSFHVNRGEAVALVGESGCGKSVTALSIMQLVPPPGKVTEGCIAFDGKDLTAMTEREMQHVRGNEIGMIFQDPMTSLNPVLSIKTQIVESLRLHQNLRGEAATHRALELLRMVGIPSPERRLAAYPHQFSGGMRQRVMIAMALACSPKLLIADEPTTALDVTIQAQIIELMKELKEKLGMSIILITHDLGVVARPSAARGGDVRRQSGGAGNGGRDIQEPTAPVHLGATEVRAQAGRHSQGQARADIRPAA